MVKISDELGRDIALVVGLTCMSQILVMLRLYASFKRKAPLGADDYWILSCAFLNFPYLAVNLWGM